MTRIEDVKLQMRQEINALIIKKFSKGLVLSTLDIEYYLDRWLEDYEAEHGEVMSEEEFIIFLDDIEEDLLTRSEIYKSGDWYNYITNVIDYGLISSMEHHMMKCKSREKADPDCIHVIFGDTEFPADDDGRYMKPNTV